MATPTPNPDYYTYNEAVNTAPIYMDGWETTLTAEWDGYSALQLANWIGLDAKLKTNVRAHALLTLETPADAPNKYRTLVQVQADNGGTKLKFYSMENLATDAPPADFLFPAGSRVYMSISAHDLQKVFNNPLRLLFYRVVNGQWSRLAFYNSVANPDGTPYTFPPVDDYTGLVLIAFEPNTGGLVVLSATRVKLGDWPVPWCTITS